MLIDLERYIFGEEATLSTVLIDGNFFGYACEDRDRGLDSAMPLAELAERKIAEKTAIPIGRYRVARTWSNRFQRVMLQVLDVPAYAGIRIHPGHGPGNTAGCLLFSTRVDEARLEVVGGRRTINACKWLEAEVERRRQEPCEIVIWRREPAWETAPGRPR